MHWIHLNYCRKKQIIFKQINGLKIIARACTSDLSIINEVFLGRVYDSALSNLPKNSVIIDKIIPEYHENIDLVELINLMKKNGFTILKNKKNFTELELFMQQISIPLTN